MTGERYNLDNNASIHKLRVNEFYEYHRIIYTDVSYPEKEEVGVYIIQVLEINVSSNIVLAKVVMAREKETLYAYKGSRKIDLRKHVGEETRIHFNRSFDSYLIEL